MPRHAIHPKNATDALHALTHPNQAEVLIGVRHRDTVEARPPIPDDNPQFTRRAANLHFLADAVRVPVRVVQRLLNDPVQRDLHRQRDLRGQITEGTSHFRLCSPLVQVDDPHRGFRERQLVEFRQAQARGDNPDLLERLGE